MTTQNPAPNQYLAHPKPRLLDGVVSLAKSGCEQRTEADL
jgi:hypothetical protein